MKKKFNVNILIIVMSLIISLGLIGLFLANAKYVRRSNVTVLLNLREYRIAESEIIVEPDTDTLYKVDVTITGNKPGVKVNYKLGEDGEWQEYVGKFEVTENTVVRARYVGENFIGPVTEKEIDNIVGVAAKLELNGVETEHVSIQAAIDTAGTKTATITLVRDVIKESVVKNDYSNLTIDLNGKVWQNDTENLNTLTVTRGNIIIKGTGKILSEDTAICITGGTVKVLDEVVIESEKNGVSVSSASLILGDNSDEVNKNWPSIFGKEAGIVEKNYNSISFYDGKVKAENGKGSAIKAVVDNTPDGYECNVVRNTVEDVVIEEINLITFATFKYGGTVNVQMKRLAGNTYSSINTSTNDSRIKEIKKSEVAPDDSIINNTNSLVSENKKYKIYMWFDNGTIYWWSDAERVNLQSGGEMFSRLRELSNIEGISEWNTSHSTYLGKMFSGCTKITDCSALEKWDTRECY